MTGSFIYVFINMTYTWCHGAFANGKHGAK